MAVNWTKEQQQVIDLRGEDLLVSAAAGSGKTAVLVERIIKKITDASRPCDIDRLLVVTFTRAAASEMRERITAALTKLLEQDPENANLIRQSALIHNAAICTIDSFCMFVVRNHFGEIGLDPNFRLADEGELRLLEHDTMDALFEKEYQTQNPAFLQLIDAYSGKRSDDEVKEMVAKICHMAESMPWPKAWISSLQIRYEARGTEEIKRDPLLEAAAEELKRYILQFRRQIESYLALASGESGVPVYIEPLQKDLALLKEGEDCRDYFACAAFLQAAEFPSLPRITKKVPADPKAKQIIHEGRNGIVKKIGELQQKYPSFEPEELLLALQEQKPAVSELCRLALEFNLLLEKGKEKRRIVSFSDIEHFALRILVDETTLLPTRTSDEFRKHYEEIMIDEYQDSNLVQESILTAISRHPEGHNLFMVGDVKQSIYRFRQARPELFMEKYARYREDRGPERKIELHNNFRSRRQVLDFANDVFYKLMGEDLGGVSYDDKAALYPGAGYPDSGEMEAEILLLEENVIDTIAGQSEGGGLDKKQAEAILTANRILELMASGSVTDKQTGELRKIRYSDIVILFRSQKEWAPIFSQVFGSYGIPVHIESSTGYFAASEVQGLLDFLRVLYNPLQDIPMAAVLKSYFGSKSDEELSQIRLDHKEMSFAEAVLAEMEKEEDSLLSDFKDTFDHYRRLSRELPIHQLIQKILTETGYSNYIASLPGGEVRLANLNMLVEKAVNYEQTSYKGLFHFVRYIDQLQKYEVDYGEADTVNENADVVKIMTIHKSKGLEFPVVFLCGMAKKFNDSDRKDKLALHSDLGLGLVEISGSPKVKKRTLYHTQINERLLQENLGEELRVLYVALTRAKEKLILTGVTPEEAKVYEKYAGNATPKQVLPYSLRHDAASVLDWMLPAVLSYPEKYRLHFASAEELILPAIKDAAGSAIQKEELYQRISAVAPEDYQEILKEFSYQYPYRRDIVRKSKYSVSELKHDSMVEKLDQLEGEMEKPAFIRQEKEACIPSFALKRQTEEDNGQLRLALEEPENTQTEKSAQPAGKLQGKAQPINRGALRGTAVHRVMECLDFAGLGRIDPGSRRQVSAFVRGELQRMTDKGELTCDMRNLIIPSAIEDFVRSQTAWRMAQAALRQELFREKPFVMEYEGILLQGIIDVFWFEGDDIVLLDYKTDYVKKADELVVLYKTQLDLYKNALERVFSDEKETRSVRETLIYSYHLQEVIVV